MNIFRVCVLYPAARYTQLAVSIRLLWQHVIKYDELDCVKLCQIDYLSWHSWQNILIQMSISTFWEMNRYGI